MSDIVERLRVASLNRDELRGGWLAEAIDEIERLRAKIAAMNAAAASLKGACVCRFDENDKLVKECAFHGDMRRALEDKQP